jgi:CRISPR-associated protein Csb3
VPLISKRHVKTMSEVPQVAETSIPVDFTNPGQVFASIGLAEAVEVLLGGAEGCFHWPNHDESRFYLRARGNQHPVETVLKFLAEAKVVAEAPHGSRNLETWNRSWGEAPNELEPGASYPSADPDSPATLVAVLKANGAELRIDYWTDSVRDNAKFWAGSGGYPGVALTRDALDLVRDRATSAITDPFALSVPQSSSFRLDWRRDYVPIDAGFSLNAHGGAIEAVGYPLVELLGAIGLTHARPMRLRTKLEYRYGVVGSSEEVVWLPLGILRAGLGAAQLPFESRRFRMYLSWPGKEGQARAITQVTEESES